MIHYATKTIDAINSALEKDQGALFRKYLKEEINKIEDAYNPEEEKPRPYLGASQIGKDCERALWYGFRLATRKKHPGRIIRLFNRGHLEEARFAALLRLVPGLIFFGTDPVSTKQFSFKDGYFSGRFDGICNGCPDVLLQNTLLCEFKTFGEKYFEQLKKEGVYIAKPEYYTQVQIGLEKIASLDACLFLAVNKNTDEIYGEIIFPNTASSSFNTQKAFQIINAQQPPKRINESPGWYKCKMCDHKEVCHQKKPMEINCRTCQYWSPQNGNAYCNYWQQLIPSFDHELQGCSNYVPIA